MERGDHNPSFAYPSLPPASLKVSHDFADVDVQGVRDSQKGVETNPLLTSFYLADVDWM